MRYPGDVVAFVEVGNDICLNRKIFEHLPGYPLIVGNKGPDTFFVEQRSERRAREHVLNKLREMREPRRINIDTGVYWLGNRLLFGLYMHGNHHKRANLFNPLKMEQVLAAKKAAKAAEAAAEPAQPAA